MKTIEELRTEYARLASQLERQAEVTISDTPQKEMLKRLYASLDDLNAHAMATVALLKRKGIISEDEYLEAVISHLE